ncbi:MAG: hypothetical protein QG622_2563, partial [Actinomycetota bacterium]|nr:hypothetical protein [Actinomycetota bacterium]
YLSSIAEPGPRSRHEEGLVSRETSPSSCLDRGPGSAIDDKYSGSRVNSWRSGSDRRCLIENSGNGGDDPSAPSSTEFSASVFRRRAGYPVQVRYSRWVLGGREGAFLPRWPGDSGAPRAGRSLRGGPPAPNRKVRASRTCFPRWASACLAGDHDMIVVDRWNPSSKPCEAYGHQPRSCSRPRAAACEGDAGGAGVRHGGRARSGLRGNRDSWM